MKPMTIAICDSVAEDALLLEKLLKKLLPDMQAEIFPNGELLIEKIVKQEISYSIVFLEIQLAGIGGIQVARAIREKDVLVPIILLQMTLLITVKHLMFWHFNIY